MNADEMFEYLDFYIVSYNPLIYEKDDGGYITRYIFNDVLKQVKIEEFEKYNENLPQGSTSFYIEHIKAIYQQMIELGWK